ncbi:MAG: hypothetical protein GY822_00055, partial [Deltaproteobacteria bacterium]|nr:hypothetical protein [Deltaproteobacteria bacterium]
MDADLVVYLTVKQEPCGGGDLGQATACSWDYATGRTLAGVINICPSALEAVLRAAPPPEAGETAEALGVADVAASAEFGALVDTIVHEAGHLLGFSTQLYPRFRDAEGRPQPAATLEGPGGRILLATPRVLEVARLHYGCDEIEGVPMEDGGGEGTRGSHWEVSWIGDRDVMLGTSFRPGRAVMSPLTLALFEDTGWFDVDWDTAGAWGFGAGLGCAVLDPETKCLDRRYFCDPSGAAGAEDAVQCTWDHMDVGRCYHSEMLPPGCGVVQPFANYLCGEPVDSPQGLWGEARGPNSRCVEVAPEPKVWQARPTRFQTVSAPRGGGAGCYAMECRDGAVSLALGGRAVPCPAGEYVDLGAVSGLDISRGTLGPCPRPEEVCPGLERADDCNGLGDSVDGECRCYLGFGGPDCSEMLASNDTVQGYSGRASEGAPGGGDPSFTADDASSEDGPPDDVPPATPTGGVNDATPEDGGAPVGGEDDGPRGGAPLDGVPSDGAVTDDRPSEAHSGGGALSPGGGDDAPTGDDGGPPGGVPADAPPRVSTKGAEPRPQVRDFDRGDGASTVDRRGLRSRLVLGPGTGARGPEAEAVLQWAAEAAFSALSQTLSVRGRLPAGGKLLLPAECDVWGSDRRVRRGREVWECARWSVPATCAGEAPHDPALFSTAAPPPRSCPAGRGPADPGCEPTAIAASGGGSGGTGGPEGADAGVDADLVVYLTVKQEPCGGGDLGQATA